MRAFVGSVKKISMLGNSFYDGIVKRNTSIQTINRRSQVMQDPYRRIMGQTLVFLNIDKGEGIVINNSPIHNILKLLIQKTYWNQNTSISVNKNFYRDMIDSELREKMEMLKTEHYESYREFSKLARLIETSSSYESEIRVEKLNEIQKVLRYQLEKIGGFDTPSLDKTREDEEIIRVIKKVEAAYLLNEDEKKADKKAEAVLDTETSSVILKDESSHSDRIRVVHDGEAVFLDVNKIVELAYDKKVADAEIEGVLAAAATERQIEATEERISALPEVLNQYFQKFEKYKDFGKSGNDTVSTERIVGFLNLFQEAEEADRQSVRNFIISNDRELKYDRSKAVSAADLFEKTPQVLLHYMERYYQDLKDEVETVKKEYTTRYEELSPEITRIIESVRVLTEISADDSFSDSKDDTRMESITEERIYDRVLSRERQKVIESWLRSQGLLKGDANQVVLKTDSATFVSMLSEVLTGDSKDIDKTTVIGKVSEGDNHTAISKDTSKDISKDTVISKETEISKETLVGQEILTDDKISDVAASDNRMDNKSDKESEDIDRGFGTYESKPDIKGLPVISEEVYKLWLIRELVSKEDIISEKLIDERISEEEKQILTGLMSIIELAKEEGIDIDVISKEIDDRRYFAESEALSHVLEGKNVSAADMEEADDMRVSERIKDIVSDSTLMDYIPQIYKEYERFVEQLGYSKKGYDEKKLLFMGAFQTGDEASRRELIDYIVNNRSLVFAKGIDTREVVYDKLSKEPETILEAIDIIQSEVENNRLTLSELVSRKEIDSKEVVAYLTEMISDSSEIRRKMASSILHYSYDINEEEIEKRFDVFRSKVVNLSDIERQVEFYETVLNIKGFRDIFTEELLLGMPEERVAKKHAKGIETEVITETDGSSELIIEGQGVVTNLSITENEIMTIIESVNRAYTSVIEDSKKEYASRLPQMNTYLSTIKENKIQYGSVGEIRSAALKFVEKSEGFADSVTLNRILSYITKKSDWFSENIVHNDQILDKVKKYLLESEIDIIDETVKDRVSLIEKSQVSEELREITKEIIKSSSKETLTYILGVMYDGTTSENVSILQDNIIETSRNVERFNKRMLLTKDIKTVIVSSEEMLEKPAILTYQKKVISDIIDRADFSDVRSIFTYLKQKRMVPPGAFSEYVEELIPTIKNAIKKISFDETDELIEYMVSRGGIQRIIIDNVNNLYETERRVLTINMENAQADIEASALSMANPMLRQLDVMSRRQSEGVSRIFENSEMIDAASITFKKEETVARATEKRVSSVEKRIDEYIISELSETRDIATNMEIAYEEVDKKLREMKKMNQEVESMITVLENKTKNATTSNVNIENIYQQIMTKMEKQLRIERLRMGLD